MIKILSIAAAASLTFSVAAAPQLLPNNQKQLNIENKLNDKLFRFTMPDGQQLTAMEIAQGQQNMKKAKAEGEVGPVIGEFPGEPRLYAMGAVFAGLFGLEYDSDYGIMAQVDEDAAYFDSKMFPRAFSETTLIRADRDGNKLTIPYQKVYSLLNYAGMYDMDCYVSRMDVDEEGNPVPSADPYELELTAEGNIITPNGVTPDNREGDIVYFAMWADLSAYGAGEHELFAYCASFNMQPFTVGEQTFLPEYAEPEEYIYKSVQSEGLTSTFEYNYIDGETVYLRGLSGGVGVWFKGTMADGKLTVPSGQFLGFDAVPYIVELRAVKNLEVNEYEGTASCDELDALTFTVTDDGFILDEGQAAALFYATSGIAFWMKELEIYKWTGFTPAKPKTPEIWGFGYVADYDQYYIDIELGHTGTKGEYLDVDAFEWCVYTDDDLYTFTTDGYYIDEDMTWIPSTFYDNEDGESIYSEEGSISLFLNNDLYTSIGIQSRYTIDDVTTYSNIIYIDMNLDEEYYDLREVEVSENGTPTGLKLLDAAKAKNLFDLQGRRATKAAKGLVIDNGTIKFMK